MYDISAANIVYVVVNFDDGFPLTFEQEDFSADSSPIRISSPGVSHSRIDMEGELVPSRRREPIRVELAPIPNTQTDMYLKEKLIAARNSDPTSYSSPTISQMTVQIKQDGNTGTLTLEDGYPADGGFLDILSEGRFSTPPYIFEFAKIDGNLPHGLRAVRYEDNAPDLGGSNNSAQPSKKKNQQQKKPQLPKSVQNSRYFGTNSQGQEVRGNWYNGNVINGRVFRG